jgi:hypothetical protein
VRRLIRRKVLDGARLLGRPVVLVAGTGLLCFHRRHCDHGLTQKHDQTTVSLPNVLQAKVLGPAGVVVSVASAFLDNAAAQQAKGQGAEQVQQDGARKAFDRLTPQLKEALPRTRLIVAGDSILACGRVWAACKDNRWAQVLTFQEGRRPAVWADFRGLLPRCPRNVLERTWPAGTRRVYRWARGLSYEDDQGRRWQFNARECRETSPAGQETRFAGSTDLPVPRGTVEDIAEKGGR